MKVSIQGESGSFHEVAARQYFSFDDIEIVPCPTFDLTLNTLKSGEADFAVMAIENARSGSILYNYTLIQGVGTEDPRRTQSQDKAEPDGPARTTDH